MKLIKPIFVSAFATLILSSCSPTLAPMVSTNPANIDKFPIKTTPVKEEDLKRSVELLNDALQKYKIEFNL